MVVLINIWTNISLQYFTIIKHLEKIKRIYLNFNRTDSCAHIHFDHEVNKTYSLVFI